MIFRRAGFLVTMVFCTLLCLSCGQVYRPVVIPLSTSPPTPAAFHTVFGISMNVPSFPGGAMQINVSGDSIAAETPSSDKSAPNLGNNPTHAAILPNLSRVFVTSAGSIVPGGVDVLSYFSPAFQSTAGSQFGAVTTISLPAGSQPVFVNTTQNAAVYVANFNSNSVFAISTATNAISNTAPVGSNPVALAETPNGLKIYVANQGGNSISSLNTADLSPNTLIGFTGTTPVWMVARADSQKVYVVTQGDGQLVTIDTATDAVTSSLPVGSGANFIFYDPHLNRLYVTNPVTNTVYVFSDTGGNGDTPVQLAAIPFALASAACTTGPSACTPASVTALPDGSRFYVATYQTAALCPDPTVTGSCVIPGLVVFDASSLTLKYPKTPTLTLLTWSPPCSTGSCPTAPFATNQYAVPTVTSCAPAALYSPSTTRFRLFTTSAADSSRVYVSMCDAGAIAVINTTNSNANNPGGSGSPSDTLVTDLPAAFSAGAIQPNGEPANQNPIFLLMGQ
ncbi:MAG: YncE family protein [Candidatus Sulfotelmatobacter sp.]|nr:YncE family protein [Candidatus Sulfotelmatobacter sp.]